MKLLGGWNWYLPSWLQWLPRLEHERTAEAPRDGEPEVAGCMSEHTHRHPRAEAPPAQPLEPRPRRRLRRPGRVLRAPSVGLPRRLRRPHPAGRRGHPRSTSRRPRRARRGREDSIATAALRDRRDRPWRLIGARPRRGRRGAGALGGVALAPRRCVGVPARRRSADPLAHALRWSRGEASDEASGARRGGLAPPAALLGIARRLARRAAADRSPPSSWRVFDVQLRSGIGERTYTPCRHAKTSASEYRLGIGELRVDLRSVALARSARRTWRRGSTSASCG